MADLTGADAHHQFAVAGYGEHTAAFVFLLGFRADVGAPLHEVGEGAGAGLERETAHGEVDEGGEDREVCCVPQLFVVAEDLVEIDAFALVGCLSGAPEGVVDLDELILCSLSRSQYPRSKIYPANGS